MFHVQDRYPICMCDKTMCVQLSGLNEKAGQSIIDWPASKKETRRIAPGFFVRYPMPLCGLDVRRLLALRSLNDVKAHLLAFLQRLEAIHGDSREVRKQILTALVGSDETEALRVVEPLNDTSCHFPTSPVIQSLLLTTSTLEKLNDWKMQSFPPHKLTSASFISPTGKLKKVPA